MRRSSTAGHAAGSRWMSRAPVLGTRWRGGGSGWCVTVRRAASASRPRPRSPLPRAPWEGREQGEPGGGEDRDRSARARAKPCGAFPRRGPGRPRPSARGRTVPRRITPCHQGVSGGSPTVARTGHAARGGGPAAHPTRRGPPAVRPRRRSAWPPHSGGPGRSAGGAPSGAATGPRTAHGRGPEVTRPAGPPRPPSARRRPANRHDWRLA